MAPPTTTVCRSEGVHRAPPGGSSAAHLSWTAPTGNAAAYLNHICLCLTSFIGCSYDCSTSSETWLRRRKQWFFWYEKCFAPQKWIKLSWISALMTRAFQSWKDFLHNLNTLSVCNQTSEHSNVSRFHMWSMPSQIHFNSFNFQFKLPFSVLRTAFLFSLTYFSVRSQAPHHRLTSQVYSDVPNTHSEHLIVA